jgi:hypothetical protein
MLHGVIGIDTSNRGRMRKHSRISNVVQIVTVTVAAITFGVLASWAGATSGAHFFKSSGSVNTNGALVVAFDEAGVGQQLVNYTLEVKSATATYACINGGGNHPKAANKETRSDSVSTDVTLNPTNGRVKASIATGPVSAGTFSCPSGQRLVLASVSYSGITLTDTTNNVTTTVADTSTIFFNV